MLARGCPTFRLRASALGVLALITASAAAAQAVTWSRTIGSMCIAGVPEARREVKDKSNVDGIAVQTFNIDYNRSRHGGRAIVRVFREPPDKGQDLSTCAELKGQVLFEGDIQELTIKAGRETDPQAKDAIFRLDPKALAISTIRTRSNLAPLYGGDLELDADNAIRPSARTWIKNEEQIISRSGKVSTGSVDVETWGRRLRGAKLLLPGATEPTTVDLTAQSDANVFIRVPFDGKPTELRKGVFIATDQTVAASRFIVPGAAIDKLAGKAGKLELRADDKLVEMSINGLIYAASAAKFDAGKTAIAMAEPSGVIKTVASPVPRFGAMLDLPVPRMDGSDASGTTCSVDYATANVTRSTACKTQAAGAVATGLKLDYSAASATAMLSAPALASHGAVQLASFASADKDTLTGSFMDTAATLGALKLAQQKLLLASPLATPGRVEFPFSFAVGPAKGTWKMSLPDGKVALEGSVEQLRAAGKVSTDLATLQNWAIEIGQGALAFDARVAATYEPILYGAKPQFGALGLKLANKTAIQATAKGATGTLLAGADVLILADPKLNFGEGDATLTLEGPARFDGAVAVAYDLGAGLAQVESGRLLVEKTKLTTRPGAPGDFGEVRISDGQFTLDRLEANLKDGKGKFEANGIAVSAAKIEANPRASDATAGNQLVWSGKPTAGVRIESLSGDIVQEGAAKEMKVAHGALRNATVVITEVKLGQGAALRFQGERFEAALAEVSDTALTGTMALHNAQAQSTTTNKDGKTDLSVNVERVQFKLQGGTPAAPAGSGSFLARGVSVDTDGKVEIRESCSDRPDFGGVPINAKATTGPIAFNVDVKGGAITGTGVAAVTFAQLRSRDGYKCQLTAIERTIVQEQRAYYHYPCPTWSSPGRMCPGWTVLVPRVAIQIDRVVEVRSLQANAFFTAISLKLDGGQEFKACGKGGAVAPLADVSYYVYPRTQVAIVDNILKEVADQFARPFASAIVSGLGGLYGSIMPLTKDGLCS